MRYAALARGSASVLALGIYLAATPVGIDLGFGDGDFGLTTSKALAKDGRDDDGNDDRDDDSSGSDDRDDDRGGSGGSDDRDDDSSGGGSDDRDDDDRSGPGGGGDDRDYDDRDDDRSGDGGGDDRDDDDFRRRGAATGAAAGASGSAGDGRLRVTKIERSADGVEVIYSNGVKEEIEGGRYELKNAAGRTVVERPATAQDLARIDSNARNSGVVARARGERPASSRAPQLPADSQASRIEVSGRNIEVVYVTGWKEEIELGRYELKDPNNNTVVQRRATAADRDRLLALSRN